MYTYNYELQSMFILIVNQQERTRWVLMKSKCALKIPSRDESIDIVVLLLILPVVIHISSFNEAVVYEFCKNIDDFFVF